MNFKFLYENLDTAFVNFAALVRFLQKQNFVGRISIEMQDYAAELLFGSGKQLKVREVDRIAGRISGGDEALQRILIRA